MRGVEPFHDVEANSLRGTLQASGNVHVYLLNGFTGWSHVSHHLLKQGMLAMKKCFGLMAVELKLITTIRMKLDRAKDEVLIARLPIRRQPHDLSGVSHAKAQQLAGAHPKTTKTMGVTDVPDTF